MSRHASRQTVVSSQTPVHVLPHESSMHLALVHMPLLVISRTIVLSFTLNIEEIGEADATDVVA